MRLLLCLGVMLPAATEAMVLSSTDYWFLVFGLICHHLRRKVNALWVKWKQAIWKMSQVLRWEKLCLCENWPIRDGFKIAAHLLGDGHVMPKRVQSEGFSCESCYLLHSPTHPAPCLKLHQPLLIWQSRQNTTNVYKRESINIAYCPTQLICSLWFCIP